MRHSASNRLCICIFCVEKPQTFLERPGSITSLHRLAVRKHSNQLEPQAHQKLLNLQLLWMFGCFWKNTDFRNWEKRCGCSVKAFEKSCWYSILSFSTTFMKSHVIYELRTSRIPSWTSAQLNFEALVTSEPIKQGCAFNYCNQTILFILRRPVCIYFTTTSCRPEPEYNLRRVMSSEPIHHEQLTKDCKQMTNN